jgi:hypothetical protein
MTKEYPWLTVSSLKSAVSKFINGMFVIPEDVLYAFK